MFHFATAFQLIQFDAVRCQPTAIRFGFGKLLFQFAVVVNFSLLGVHQQYLARLQATFFLDVSRFEVHDAYFACHHHHVVVCDEVTRRTQSVTVEHATCETSVAEQQCGRAVPRFHQDGMVFVEGFQVFTDGILLIEGFRHQHSHSVGQTHAGHYEEFQHIVQ